MEAWTPICESILPSRPICRSRPTLRFPRDTRNPPELGGDFLVAIPTRDVFIAFPITTGAFIERLRQRIVRDFHNLPYPITENLFLVTLDGVAPWQDAA